MGAKALTLLSRMTRGAYLPRVDQFNTGIREVLHFRVAKLALCARQIAAICATAVPIGAPAFARDTRTSAYRSAARSSNGRTARLPRSGSRAASIAPGQMILAPSRALPELVSSLALTR